MVRAYKRRLRIFAVKFYFKFREYRILFLKIHCCVFFVAKGAASARLLQLQTTALRTSSINWPKHTLLGLRRAEYLYGPTLNSAQHSRAIFSRPATALPLFCLFGNTVFVP